MVEPIHYRRDLWKLLSDVTDAVVCEIGVAEGNFSRDICEWGVKLCISVDAWECITGQTGDGGFSQDWHNANYAHARDLLRPYGGRSKILRGRTTAMAQYVADNSVDLVYIDADHSYTGCIQDIHAWWSKLKSGAVCAFHDFRNTAYGVNQAVHDFADAFGLEIFEIPEDKDVDAGAYIIKP